MKSANLIFGISELVKKTAMETTKALESTEESESSEEERTPEDDEVRSFFKNFKKNEAENKTKHNFDYELQFGPHNFNNVRVKDHQIMFKKDKKLFILNRVVKIKRKHSLLRRWKSINFLPPYHILDNQKYKIQDIPANDTENTNFTVHQYGFKTRTFLDWRKCNPYKEPKFSCYTKDDGYLIFNPDHNSNSSTENSDSEYQFDSDSDVGWVSIS